MKATAISRQRRAEGMTEYVILFAMVMLCALTGLMLMVDNVRDQYQRTGSRVCVECPEAMTMEELRKLVEDYEAKELAGTLTDEERAAYERAKRELDRREDAEARNEVMSGRTDAELESRRDELERDTDLSEEERTELEDIKAELDRRSGTDLNDQINTYREYSWLFDMVSWFSGGRYWWELLGWI